MNIEISDQNAINDNPLPHSSLNVIIIHCVRNRYITHPLPIFNFYLFNRIKIAPIYALEPSKPISFIKRKLSIQLKHFLLDLQRS